MHCSDLTHVSILCRECAWVETFSSLKFLVLTYLGLLCCSVGWRRYYFGTLSVWYLTC